MDVYYWPVPGANTDCVSTIASSPGISWTLRAKTFFLSRSTIVDTLRTENRVETPNPKSKNLANIS